MAQNILTETDGNVGIVTLNRPERGNALDDPTVIDLMQALARMGADPAVRVVVLSGTGRIFCAGSPEESPDAGKLAEMLEWMARLGKPTVARVHGVVEGEGIGLVAACDVAIAAFDAEFMFSGAAPAVIPQAVAAIGERHARRYLLTGERFSASEAYRIGLVHEIVPDEESLDAAIGEIVESLLRRDPQAAADCKARIGALHPDRKQ